MTEQNLPEVSGSGDSRPVFARKQGMWSRGSGDTSVWGSVLPDGGRFFYTNSSLDHNALYGRLIRYENNATNNRFVTANDGVFFNRLLANTGAYNELVMIDGTLQSSNGSGNARLFSGSFS